MERLREILNEDEGCRYEVYLDSEGCPTCGRGHHLYVGSKVPAAAVEAFFDQDIGNAISDFSRLRSQTQALFNPVRRRVMICLFFQMGYSSVLKFARMWKAIRNGDWVTASMELLDSSFGRKYKTRATKLATMLRTGIDLEEPDL